MAVGRAKYSVPRAVKTDVDVDVDADVCADVDGDAAPDAKMEHLTAVVRVLNLRFLVELFVMATDHLMTTPLMSVSKNLHLVVAVHRVALNSADSVHCDPKTYCLAHDATDLFDQL